MKTSNLAMRIVAGLVVSVALAGCIGYVRDGSEPDVYLSGGYYYGSYYDGGYYRYYDRRGYESRRYGARPLGVSIAPAIVPIAAPPPAAPGGGIVPADGRARNKRKR